MSSKCIQLAIGPTLWFNVPCVTPLSHLLFASWLLQGLRIAPPEAPVTGYMFGKGVYFADMVSKSANYCCTSRLANVGLMLLCEVALGDM